MTRLEKLFACLPKEKMYMKACAAFGISALLFVISLSQLFKIVTNPAVFVSIFTLAVLAAIAGLALWNGPQDYMIKIFQKKFLVRTVGLFGSMFFSLLFSIVVDSYVLSLIFTILEFNFILLYFCNTFPLKGGLQSAKAKIAGASMRNSLGIRWFWIEWIWI